VINPRQAAPKCASGDAPSARKVMIWQNRSAGVIDEESVARPFDSAHPRQRAVQGIAEPIDQQARTGEPQPTQ